MFGVGAAFTSCPLRPVETVFFPPVSFLHSLSFFPVVFRNKSKELKHTKYFCSPLVPLLLVIVLLPGAIATKWF